MMKTKIALSLLFFGALIGRVHSQEGSHPATSISARAENKLAIGESYQLLIKKGVVYAWGVGPNGELGIGKTEIAQPTPLNTLENIVAVASGGVHSLALAADGQVWAWGTNSDGQLGLGGGDTNNYDLPQPVPGIGGVIGIAASLTESIFLKDDGSVWVSGKHNTFHSNGEVVMLSLPRPVIDIAGGSIDVGLAIDVRGDVWAWGSNWKGIMGDLLACDVPKRKTEISDAIAISVGADQCLVLKADGSVWAWGNDDKGQVGGNSGSVYKTAVQLNQNINGKTEPLSDIKAISGGFQQSIFLKTNGQILRCGAGPVGQGIVPNARYVDEFNLPFHKGLLIKCATGSGIVHASVNSEGLLYRWYGNIPEQPFLEFAIEGEPARISGGNTNSLSLATNGETAPAVSLSNGQPVIATATGRGHSLFLSSDGTVWAKGSNTDGQLGNGNNIDAADPVQVAGLANAVAIAAGDDHSVALLADGTVFAWGDNQFGQLGNNSISDSNIPVQMLRQGKNSVPTPIVNAKEIAAGKHHTVALISNAEVVSAGRNADGELGTYGVNAYQSVAVRANLVVAKHISAGGSNSASIAGNGIVLAWGKNDEGQLGRGFVGNSSGDAKNVIDSNYATLSGIKAISLGSSHGMALTSRGHVMTWGRNIEGQIAIGNNFSKSAAQVSVEQNQATQNVKSLSAGGLHSLVLKADGTICASGLNDQGQLGDGTTINKNMFSCNVDFDVQPVPFKSPETQQQFVNSLYDPYPNPASSSAAITYSLAEPASVRVAIFDQQGDVVKTLTDGIQQQGVGQLTWDGKDSNGRAVPEGIYVVKMMTGAFFDSKRISWGIKSTTE